MAKHDALKNHIEDFEGRDTGTQGACCWLPTKVCRSPIRYGADPNRVAAMAAASNPGRRFSDSMSIGALGEIASRGDEG